MSGDLPCARFGSSAVCFRGKLWIFGGGTGGDLLRVRLPGAYPEPTRSLPGAFLPPSSFPLLPFSLFSSLHSCITMFRLIFFFLHLPTGGGRSPRRPLARPDYVGVAPPPAAHAPDARLAGQVPQRGAGGHQIPLFRGVHADVQPDGVVCARTPPALTTFPALFFPSVPIPASLHISLSVSVCASLFDRWQIRRRYAALIRRPQTHRYRHSLPFFTHLFASVYSRTPAPAPQDLADGCWGKPAASGAAIPAPRFTQLSFLLGADSPLCALARRASGAAPRPCLRRAACVRPDEASARLRAPFSWPTPHTPQSPASCCSAGGPTGAPGCTAGAWVTSGPWSWGSADPERLRQTPEGRPRGRPLDRVRRGHGGCAGTRTRTHLTGAK